MTDIAIVLDIDGLMVDTEPLSRLAWDRVLAPFQCSLDDEFYTSIIGYRIDESVQMIIEKYDLPLSPEEVIELKRIEYDLVLKDGVPVMPGLYDLIQAIQQQHIPWAVATSSPYRHAQRILKQLELTGSCSAIAAGDEVPRGKPAPDIYLLAAERLELPAAHCMAIEDSVPGCQAAMAAGMMTLAVPNGDTKRTEFPDVQQVYTSLSDIARELARLIFELKNRTS